MEIVQPEENLREIQLTTGNKIKIRRTDPFGLWHFEYQKGPIPKELEGHFTKVSYAIKTLEAFFENSKLRPGPEEKAPPPKTKHVSAKAKAQVEAIKEEDFAKREAPVS